MESEREQITKSGDRLEFLRRLCGYFRGGSPGVSFIEYLMIAGLASLGAIAGFQHLNGARNSAVEEQAHIVRDIPDRAPPSGLISDPSPGRPGMPGMPGIPGGIGIVPRPDGRPGLPVIQPSQCFGAGTLVAAEHGNRPIEALTAGDLVWSRNVTTGATELKPVVTTYVTQSRPVLALDVRLDALRSERVLVTEDHPFFSAEKGIFVPARELASNPVASFAASSPLVAALESFASRITVYNIEVADFHTYFIGEARLLVHNICSTVVKPYKEWIKEKPDGYQINHLNQDAVYGRRGNGRIKYGDGYAIPLQGGTGDRDPPSEHYKFHRSLEDFWDEYRTGGDHEGEMPTNAQYGQALRNALIDAGFSEADADRMAAGARWNRIENGYLDDQEVPRIPGRFL
jgi:hypothetical protein